MGIPIVQVDAFSAVPFGGNPAAVCFLPGPAEDRWMAQVAMENNLSETAFLYPEGDAYRLRWFTPAVEVDLCGHATLGTAYALWTEGYLSPDAPARFLTKSGLLTCTQSNGWIEMNFPATFAVEAAPPAQLSEALGCSFAWVGKNKFDYLIEVGDEATVRGLDPAHHLLRQLPVRGVIVTAKGSGEYDFVSRFFAPGAGIDEDPVTGSAHCSLAPYWAKRLGRSSLTGYQASKRGGVVGVRVEGDRVVLRGQAVTTMRGELLA